jgi:hypothetical protein
VLPGAWVRLSGLLMATVRQVQTLGSIVASASLTFAQAVDAGDLLILVFVGSGYAAAAGVVSAVSDNVNGPWVQLYNSGDQNDGANHHYSLAVYYVSSKSAPAGGLTVSVTASAGQGASSAAVVDWGGVATGSPIDRSAFGAVSADASGAGDEVVLVMGGYQGFTVTAGAGETLDAPLGAGTSTASLGAAHRNTTTVQGETPNGTFGGYAAGAELLAGTGDAASAIIGTDAGTRHVVVDGVEQESPEGGHIWVDGVQAPGGDTIWVDGKGE